MKHEQLLIQVASPGTAGEFEIESVWAKKEEDGYRLDNIPFYALGFAWNDIVSVSERDGSPYVDQLVRPSGHSTVRIWFSSEDLVPKTREELKRMGCSSEVSDNKKNVAVDIPLDVDYGAVKKFLDDGLLNAKWDFEEACLGFLE